MFGDGLKLMEFALSTSGVLSGLAILLADGNGRGGGDLNSDRPIVGSWAGDPIVIAGDYADNGKFLPADKQDVNLHNVAENEGKDISAKVIEALLDDTHFAEDFLKIWENLNRGSDSYYKDVIFVINAYKLKNGIVPKANHHSVIGSKGDKYEVVDLNNGTGVWTCTCPAYTYHKVPGTDCKHIKEVKQKLSV
jgi:hypothetical protein